MNGGNSVFVSGAILGAALGFTAGHLFVWGRDRPESESHSPVVTQSIPPFELAPSPYFPPQDDLAWLTPGDGSSIEATEYAGRGEIVFADIQEPDSTAAVVSGMTAGATHAGSAIGTSVDEPEALPSDSAAVPITIRNAEEEEQLLELLRTELPKLTEEQRHVWMDVVRGMPHNEVTDILSIWKHMGGRPPEIVPPLALGKGGRSPSVSITQPPVQHNGSGDITQAEQLWRRQLARAKNVVLTNLLNIDTPGYVRGKPFNGMLANSTDTTVCETEVLDFDSSKGSLYTGRLLDFCYHGGSPSVVLFELKSGDKTAYTRLGRFTLNSDRVLVQVRHGVEWKLIPEVQIGTDVNIDQLEKELLREAEATDSTELEPWWISLGLNVPIFTNFPHPERLCRGEDDLLLATESAGDPVKSSPSSDCRYWFSAGRLSKSGTDTNAESAALDEIEARWKLLGRVRQLPE